MATKKSAATTKKPVKKAPVAKKTTTKVTTVKATAKPEKVSTSSSAAALVKPSRFSFSRTPILGASVAEFLGTFLLAAVVLATQNQPLFVLVGLVAIILTVGGVSGAHFNPALTIGALATKRIKASRAGAYVVAQILGGVLALVVMNGFISAAPEVTQQAAAFGQSAPTLFTATAIAGGTEWTLLAAELLGMVILAFAVATAMRYGRSALHAVTYAGGLYVAALVAGTAGQYIGGTNIFNPAVAASLQALKFELWPVMVYIVTPLVGGVLGFVLNDLLTPKDSERV